MPRPCLRCGHAPRQHPPAVIGGVEPTSRDIPCIAYIAPLSRIERVLFKLIHLGGSPR